MLARTRRPGETYLPDEICWIDFEARCKLDLKQVGAYRYATEAEPIVLAYAIGDGPVAIVAAENFDEPLDGLDLPVELLDFYDRVLRGEAVFAAWHAGFDRAIWNFAMPGSPPLLPRHIIDPMAQAAAAGLPPDLALSSLICGLPKLASGKELIKLFCLPGSTATPESHPVQWAEFLRYAGRDVEAMRAVFKLTNQLSAQEWAEYWAMEEVNENGIGVDVRMAGAAAALASQDRERARQELFTITRGLVKTVDQVKVMTEYLLRHLPPEGREILLKREAEFDEDGEEIRPPKYALRRRQVERLLAYTKATMAEPPLDLSPEQLTGLIRADRVLQIRLYGGSKTPAKFSKILQQHVDGVVYGQYTFNGAAQTGRASSKGVQIQNLARDALPYEHDAIEAILAGCTYDELAQLGDDTPVSRKLSLLIRPTFIAGPGRLFVWSDWSQIEARVLPWLAGERSQGAMERLRIFEDVDEDPALPDLYTRTAAALSHVPFHEVTKAMRQRGKVAELALGFMGGVGALQAMGAGYGLHLTDEEAAETVGRWRAVNRWAVDFSQMMWEGMRAALDNPMKEVYVGRIVWGYKPNYLGGTMLMQLPSGRLLTYRNLKWENIAVLDDDDQPTGELKLELTCRRGYGRIKLWPGIFVENATQATAADFLRGTLPRLNEAGHLVRLHSHDEILTEVEEDRADAAKRELRDTMLAGFWWSKGLPLMSEETVAPYYTKLED